MNTADLKTFTTVYECSSFSQASKRLFLTPQELQKLSPGLKRNWISPFFFRTKRGITPTEYAGTLYEKAKTFN